MNGRGFTRMHADLLDSPATVFRAATTGSALDVAAVLEIVRVAVPAVALVMLIGVLAPKLSVGAS